MKRWNHPILVGIMLFILFLSFSACVMALENPWGYTRVLGYKDPFPYNCGRSFTPFAILQDVSYAKDAEEMYLNYTYARYSNTKRLWNLYLTDGKGNSISTNHELMVVLPYPSVWSAEKATYWKWTQNYAERYDWYYAKGNASIYYRRGTSVRLMSAGFYGSTGYRQIQNMNRYGVEVFMGKGWSEKAVFIHFVDENTKPSELQETEYFEED